jgi:hypothetical protein
VRRFDGTWLGRVGCTGADALRPWRQEFIGEVKEGIFHGQWTYPGRPEQFSTYDGKIGSDGKSLISFKGPKGAWTGLPFIIIIKANFQGAHGTGTWNHPAETTCTAEFERVGEANFAPVNLIPEQPNGDLSTPPKQRATGRANSATRPPTR